MLYFDSCQRRKTCLRIPILFSKDFQRSYHTQDHIFSFSGPIETRSTMRSQLFKKFLKLIVFGSLDTGSVLIPGISAETE